MKSAAESGSGDMHTKFLKDWFRYSEVDKGDAQTHRHTDMKEIAQA
jgi:hypothetical protein